MQMEVNPKPPKRQRLRFSMRLLLIATTLVSLYFACWRPTATSGVADVSERLTRENRGVPSRAVAKAPLLLAREVQEIRSRPGALPTGAGHRRAKGLENRRPSVSRNGVLGGVLASGMPSASSKETAAESSICGPGRPGRTGVNQPAFTAPRIRRPSVPFLTLITSLPSSVR